MRRRALLALPLLAVVAAGCYPPPPPDGPPRMVILGDSLVADAGTSIAIDGVVSANAGVGGSGLYTDTMTTAWIDRLGLYPIEGAVVGISFTGNVDHPTSLGAPDWRVADRYATNFARLLDRLRALGAARVVWLEPPAPLPGNVLLIGPATPRLIADAIVARYGLARYRVGRCPAARPDGVHFDGPGSVMFGRTAAAATWHGAELCIPATPPPPPPTTAPPTPSTTAPPPTTTSVPPTTSSTSTTSTTTSTTSTTTTTVPEEVLP